MSNKVSKIVKDAEVIEEAVANTVDTEVENVTTDLAATEEAQSMKVVKQGRVKSTWNWVKKHPWTVVGSVAAGLGVILLGKKVYDAGMPAEFDVDAINNDPIEQPTEHAEVEIKEEQVSEEE